MRTFYTFFILLVVPLAVWGQRLPQYNPCKGIDARLSHSSIVYKEVGKDVFHSPRVLNIEQTSEGTTNKHYIYLRAAFTQPNNSGKWGLRFGMVTPPNIEPVQRNGNYPEGVNVDKWYNSKANIPAGARDNDAPKADEYSNPEWPSFSRYSNRTLTIGIKRKELDNFTGDINTATYNNQSNPIAVKFEVSPNIHRKNLKMKLKMDFYNGEETRRGPVTLYKVGYCDHPMNSDNNHKAHPIFSIDLIRPTFENMPETTTKVDEVFELSIPAKDVDESGATIAQNFPTNVTPESYQDMEDGVFINLISVKKIVNLAGGVNAKSPITTTAFQKACI